MGNDKIKNKMQTQEFIVFKRIANLLFGYKYYANIVCTRGTTRTEICSYIFRSKEEARKHQEGLELNRTFKYIETISFRSRKAFYKVPDDLVDHCIK